MALPLIVHSDNPTVGRGQYNFGQYSDPAMDTLIDSSFANLDPAVDNPDQIRHRPHGSDQVVLPLYFQKVITASRADLSYTTDPTKRRWPGGLSLGKNRKRPALVFRPRIAAGVKASFARRAHS